MKTVNELADEYVEQGFFKLEYGNSGNTAKEVLRSMHIDTMAWNIKTTDKEILAGWHESNNEAIEQALKGESK